MSRVLATIAIEDAAVEPLGAKEALVMAVEHLGGVQVLSVEVQEPEQLGMAGGTFVPPKPRPKSSPPKPAPSGQAQPAALAVRGRPWSAALPVPAIDPARTGTRAETHIGVYAGVPDSRCTI